MPKGKRACRKKAVQYPDMEKDLLDWVCFRRNNGNIVTTLQIQRQALTLMSSVPSFKASTGWTQKFMKRHGLALHQKTKIAQKLLDDLKEKIFSFYSFVLNLLEEHQFDLYQIGNMDETSLCFD